MSFNISSSVFTSEAIFSSSFFFQKIKEIMANIIHVRLIDLRVLYEL